MAQSSWYSLRRKVTTCAELLKKVTILHRRETVTVASEFIMHLLITPREFFERTCYLLAYMNMHIYWNIQIKYILELLMVECSMKSFVSTEIQDFIFLHLFTDLFHKDSSSLFRINCSYFISKNISTPPLYTLYHMHFQNYSSINKMQID